MTLLAPLTDIVSSSSPCTAQLLMTLLAPLKDIDSSSSPCTTRSRSGHEQAILGHISMQQDCNSCSESVAGARDKDAFPSISAVEPPPLHFCLAAHRRILRRGAWKGGSKQHFSRVPNAVSGTLK